MKIAFPLLLLGVFFMSACHRSGQPTKLFSGLKITESTVIDADTFHLSVNEGEAVIYIKGENIVVDFNEAVLIGSDNMERPDLFSGTAVSILGKNVTVKNAIIRGFKTAVFAESVDGLKLLDCDLSYNFKCKNSSTWCESFALKILDCKAVHIVGLKITNGQDGVFFKDGKSGVFYNNIIEYNSGNGLVMKDVEDNIVKNNRINWNARYGVLISGGDNKFQDNSMTHNLSPAICPEIEKCGVNGFYHNNFAHAFQSSQDSLLFFDNFIVAENFDPFLQGTYSALDSTQLQGRQYILKDEWGIYDFKSPSIWLRNKKGNEYTFLLLGPPVGNYKIVDGEGWEKLNRVSGAFPATLIATAKPEAEKLSLELEFIGQEFIDRFGQVNKKGKVFPFRWEQ